MKNTFFIPSGCVAMFLSLFIAGAAFGQSGKTPFLIDIPNAEEPCHMLSGDHNDKYLTLFAEYITQTEGASQVISTDPAPKGLYLSKNGAASESKWAFKPVQEDDANGDYFMECMDGTGRLVGWSDVEGFFFRPLSMMDGKMREMATWKVTLGGVNDIGVTYFVIHPAKALEKVLAVDRATSKIGVFNKPGTALGAKKKVREEERKERKPAAAPNLEILWKRECKISK